MNHYRTVKLLGGLTATLSWDDEHTEGDILYREPEFLSYIHQHTRDAAAEHASTIAPHVLRWIHTLHT